MENITINGHIWFQTASGLRIGEGRAKLLEEIEKSIRVLLDGAFLVEDIKKICANAEKEITSIDDLSFGDYKRIIENPNLWGKLKIHADKKLLTDRLDESRKIRNEIMHFAPDGIDKEAIVVLNDTSKYLATLIKYKYPEGKEN